MNVPLIEDLAAFIRRVDGNNAIFPAALGRRIGWTLADRRGIQGIDARAAYIERVVAFVERTNPDKRMGAGALAQRIAAEFGLDGEG